MRQNIRSVVFADARFQLRFCFWVCACGQLIDCAADILIFSSVANNNKHNAREHT